MKAKVGGANLATLGRLGTGAALGLFLAWFFLLRPAFLGGPASYIIVDGASMEPTLYNDDLAVMRAQEEYRPGDVVAFRVKGGIVIHRIVGGTAEEGFVLRGDNRNAPDPWHPRQEDILGRMWFHIPRGGRVVVLARQPIVFATLVSALGVLIVLTYDEEDARPQRHVVGTSPGSMERISRHLDQRPRPAAKHRGAAWSRGKVRASQAMPRERPRSRPK